MKAQYENHYLTDKDVANYARQSFADVASNFTEAKNADLIRFLARGMTSGDWGKIINQMQLPLSRQEAHALAVRMRSIPEHWVPFGHPHITLRMSAPIPIRVQCFKHKVGLVESEESRRYISSTPVVYMPEHFRATAANVKQGSAGAHAESDYWLHRYSLSTRAAIETYNEMIDAHVCPEQARFVLPQGCEVNWVWTGSLYAFANIYNLRTDPHAQLEIQELIKEAGDIIAPLYPVSWAALTSGNY